MIGIDHFSVTVLVVSQIPDMLEFPLLTKNSLIHEN
jgi:hypothetical protein